MVKDAIYCHNFNMSDPLFDRFLKIEMKHTMYSADCQIFGRSTTYFLNSAIEKWA